MDIIYIFYIFSHFVDMSNHFWTLLDNLQFFELF
jgi:hypothetical protein